MINRKVLIRCDASKEIGLGHITRCLELAKQLKKKDFEIIFAIKPYEICIEKIKEKDFSYVSCSLENFDYKKWILDCINKLNIDIFIADVRDGLPCELITLIKSKNILTIAIDEPSDYAKECDLCFYPPHAKIDKTLYKGKVYQGLEYVILREEFYGPFEKVKNEIPNILVMMGGTDAHNLTLDILKELEFKKDNFSINVILNKKNKQYEDVILFKKNSNKNIKIFSNINNMSMFLNNIDFGIISFGVSTYELLCKRIPNVNICLDDEHFNSCDFFEKNSYSICVRKEKLQIEDIFLEKDMLNFNVVECQMINKIKDSNENRMV